MVTTMPEWRSTSFTTPSSKGGPSDRSPSLFSVSLVGLVFVLRPAVEASASLTHRKRSTTLLRFFVHYRSIHLAGLSGPASPAENNRKRHY